MIFPHKPILLISKKRESPFKKLMENSSPRLFFIASA